MRGSPMTAAWSRPADELLRRLEVSPGRGLAADEVLARRAGHGANLLRRTKPRPAWRILLDQLRSLIVGLLAVAAGVSFLFQEWVEGLAILTVLVVNTALGFLTEWRAVRSMDALRRMGAVAARVRRGGVTSEVPAEDLVPGDIVLLEGGDVVTADVRLITASHMQSDESALTGESMPVDKDTAPTDPDAALHERSSVLFKGTALTRGSGEGVVFGTGMETELGRIARLVAEAHEESTPLEKRLAALGQRLVWFTLLIALGTSLLGLWAGKSLFLMIEMGIALAVAAIPEGLPVVATIALARGMWRMAKRNALVNRLSAVEVLGATTVIFTDKTGTLTENRLTVERVVLPGRVVDLGSSTPGTSTPGASDERLLDALSIGVLCNNATLAGPEGGAPSGDPLEVALLEAGLRAGLHREELLADRPELREEAFDSTSRMMATVHEHADTCYFAVKGAAEAVLAACTSVASPDGRIPMTPALGEEWLRHNEALARDGLRVLGFAQKSGAAGDPIYEGLTFVGLLGFLDPPRMDVKHTIEACHRAGIRVVMVTGDQAATARHVGRSVGIVDEEDARVVEGRELAKEREAGEGALLDVALFARVSPEQKLDLIAMHQAAGAVVAMTGDGVNDAPALKKADIGVAMGQRGTQVAREAADMILKDDALSSIEAAIREGRIIFGNIRRFVVYLLSCNVSEILVVSGAALVQAPLPLLPLQILFLNLVTDVFPALALAFGGGDAAVMDVPPRPPREPILTRTHWRVILGYALLISLSTMGVFYVAVRIMHVAPKAAVTYPFLTLAFAQLWHVFNVREPGSRRLRNHITQHPWVWGALGLCALLLLAAVYVPLLASLLHLTRPTPAGWGLILGGSLLPLALGQSQRRYGVR